MKRTLASIILTSVVLMLTLVPFTVWGYALNDQNKPLSREILTEGMVLLKNENDVLPLQSTDRIAVFGSSCLYTGKTTNGFQIGGGGSSELMPDYTPIDLLSALEEAEKAGEISIYKPLADAYRNDISYIPDEKMYADARAATDKAVMIFSRYSSESSDRKAEKGDWYLSDEEIDMLKSFLLYTIRSLCLSIRAVLSTHRGLSAKRTVSRLKRCFSLGIPEPRAVTRLRICFSAK